MTVSVVICCYTDERFEQIREAISSIQNQEVPADEIIVVVDNNEALYQRLTGHFGTGPVFVRNTGPSGASAARNCAILQSTGDVVAFLDDDARAAPSWLENILRHFDDDRVWSVGGAAELDWEGERPTWFPAALEWTLGGPLTWMPVQPSQVRNPMGHNMAFRRRAFDEAGLFDVSIGRMRHDAAAGEEAEFCLRLFRSVPGARVLYDPAARVLHHVPRRRQSLSYVLTRAYQEGICKGRISRSFRTDPVDQLSTEKTYLRYLLMRAFPDLATRFWRPSALSQLATLVVAVAAVGAGYCRSTLAGRSSPEGL